MSVVSDARPKLAARSAGRRRRLLRRLLPLVGGLALAGFAVWVLVFSSWLGVRTVEVVGEQRIPAAEVLRVAAVPIGRPLARLDGGAIAARVQGLAPVAQVTVQRRWPWTVRLLVTERVPFARVRIDGVAWIVDRSGTAFAKAGQGDASLTQLDTAHPGPADASTQAGLDVLAALPARVRAILARIEVPGPEQVTLALTGGKRVMWGSADDTAKKATVLDGLLKQAGSVYDVSSPDVVTVR